MALGIPSVLSHGASIQKSNLSFTRHEPILCIHMIKLINGSPIWLCTTGYSDYVGVYFVNFSIVNRNYVCFNQ